MNEARNEPLLFSRYPGLKGKIPWISLGVQKTPVEQLKGHGHDHLWIKRDDLTSPIYGGNKIRKLEFALADALARRKKRVVTLGGIGTNHGLATSVYCSGLGLDCSVVVYDQPVTRNVKANLEALLRCKTEVIYRPRFLSALAEFFLLQRLRHPFSYFLEPGGSGVSGNLGYVDAALELKAQVDAGEIPEPACIICPVGSSGTAAGLLLGCRLAGLKSEIVGVLVFPSKLGPLEICSAATIQKQAVTAYAYLKQQVPDLPQVEIPQPALICDYLGAGYGHPTREGKEARRQMLKMSGISLDPCYTAKAFAAALGECAQKKDQSDPLLFWNTYNSSDLSGLPGADLPLQTPIELQHILETDAVIS